METNALKTSLVLIFIMAAAQNPRLSVADSEGAVYKKHRECLALGNVEAKADCVDKLQSRHPGVLLQPVPRGQQQQQQQQQNPRTSIAGGWLIPLAELLQSGKKPADDLGAYGMVAFTAKPLSHEVQRYKYVCEAYKAALIPTSNLDRSTPRSVQMITYWPVLSEKTASMLVNKISCDELIGDYDLKSGLDAITDADKAGEGLAAKRGPFLIGWSPAKSRFEKDSVVLVMDLSPLDNQISIMDVFKAWRQKIIDDPKLWRNGWDWQKIRLTLRDTLDRYGESVVKLIKINQ